MTGDTGMNLHLPQDYWTLVLFVVPVGTLYASYVDYRERRVPNWLNGALAGGGVLAQCVYFGWTGLGDSLAGLLLGFGLLIIPWAMHGMGAGDVKLMAAIGAWFGPWLTLLGFGAGVLIGGVMAGIMIVVGGKMRQAYANLGIIVTKCMRVETAFSDFGSVRSFGGTTTLLPYGIPLTIGSLGVLFGKYFGWSVLS